MAKMFRTEDFRVENARILFARDLFEPRSFEGKPARYGCTLVFPKSAAGLFHQKLIECVKGQWPTNGEERLKAGLINNPLLDGAGKSARNKQTSEILPGYGEDKFFIRTTPSDFPPPVHFRSGETRATKEEVYSGCYGFAVINFFAYPAKNGGQDGIGTNLVYLQKTGEGDSLEGQGGKAAAGKYYEKIADSGEPAPAGASDKGAAALFG